MAIKTITSANSQLFLTIPGIFDAPVAIEGYAADTAFANEPIKVSETTMGIDGIMSAGYTPEPTKIKITLSPDSPSKDIFDQWYLSTVSARDTFFANGWLTLPSVHESYTFTRGALTVYHGAPSGKKKLEPVEYEITFNSISKGSF